MCCLKSTLSYSVSREKTMTTASFHKTSPVGYLHFCFLNCYEWTALQIKILPFSLKFINEVKWHFPWCICKNTNMWTRHALSVLVIKHPGPCQLQKSLKCDQSSANAQTNTRNTAEHYFHPWHSIPRIRHLEYVTETGKKKTAQSSFHYEPEVHLRT